METLKGKVALVTGASKGIGAGIAKRLAKSGARVVVNYASDKAGADRVVAAIVAEGGEAVVAGGSVAKQADVKALLDTVRSTYGRLDILVNNAGVYKMEPLEAVSEEEIDRIFDTNVKGLLLVTKAALPLFPAEGGSVINIGSVVSEFTPPTSAVYGASKGAVDVITRVLAKELGPKKIRVNSVNPGLVITEGVHTAGIAGSDFEAGAVASTPLGRVGQPDDIADVAAFLASDDARWVTGSLLHAAGGFR